MARMDPISRDQVPQLKDGLSAFEARMGFIPTSLLTLARRPEILKAFLALGKAVYETHSDNLPLQLKNMIGHVASRAAGCMYCSAHTANNALRPGSDLDAGKLEDIWAYETSPLFSEKERAALRFAQCAASVPNLVEDEHVEDLRQFFSEEEIVEILSVVCFFGFLNRWNDSMASDLEPDPARTGQDHLSHRGWSPGKHSVLKKL